MVNTSSLQLSAFYNNSDDFHPLIGMSNPHIQTILPRLVRRKVNFKPHWQRLDMPDGDFIELAWSEDPCTAQHKPRLVVFHGLEGSLQSPYVHGLIEAAQDRGWLGVVMHFRGCSGIPNRNNRIYHSAETDDAIYFLSWMKRRYGEVPTSAVGYSLGGNMLAYLLGTQGDESHLQAAAVVSAPLKLEECCYHMEQGFSRFYQYYLLNLLKKNAARKISIYPNTLPITHQQLKKIHRIREFDDLITAKIHGFNDALDYYRKCSAMPMLPNIRVPTLMIHAQDDPFMDHHVIPDKRFLSPSIEYQLTRYGGHVGFVGGSILHPKMWLEERIPNWLTPYMET